MNTISTVSAIGLLTWLLAGPATGQHQQQVPTEAAALIRNPTVLQPAGDPPGHRLMLTPEVLADQPTRLRIDLPRASVVALRRESVRRPTGATWTGWLEGATHTGDVVLTSHRGLVAGRIETPSVSYVLEPIAPGVSRLVEVSERGHGDCAVEATVETLFDTATRPRAELSEPGVVSALSTITILGLYSSGARLGAGGTDQIETILQAGIDLTNTAFANSGINATVELAMAAEIDLTRFGDLSGLEDALVALENDAEIRALRDAARADLVAAIFEGGGGFCGYANAMDDVGPSFAPEAFSISVRGCVLSSLALTHEIGHNLGARHDPPNSDATPETASFPWSFAHATAEFRTVMSVPLSCAGCRLEPYFSNPSVTVPTSAGPIPTGIEGHRDNQRTLNTTAPIAAAFRGPEAVCVADEHSLCLNQNRFRVTVDWRDFAGNDGRGRSVTSSADSGLFWFFEPSNWELMVKVIDACSLTDSFWVFSAATTDVEYTLRVTDTVSGVTTEYANPLGRAAPAITDTSAFSTCDTAGPDGA